MEEVNYSENDFKTKKRSPIGFIGKIILYFILFPLITSWIYILYHGGEDNYFTQDIPLVAKVIAVLLWICLLFFWFFGKLIFH